MDGDLHETNGHRTSRADLLVKSRHRGYSFSSPGLTAEQVEEENEKLEKEKQPKVSMVQLFRYSTWPEALMAIAGCIGALVHGAILPAFALIFGELVDSFNTPGDIEDTITDISVYFLYAGAVAMVSYFVQAAFFGIVAERQTRRIRNAYFQGLLRQEVGWYDRHDTGELVTRITGDTIVIQEAIGDKLGTALQMTATFLAGYIVGFITGWRLALVILAVSPLLAAGGFFLMKMMSSLTTKGQTAYAKAGGVATEVLSSMRTVVAFGGEQKELDRYTRNLDDAKRIGIRRGFCSGLGLGFVLFTMFGTYGLALWYGSELVIDELMTGGDVLTTFFAVLIGSFALGQVGPSMEAVSKGQGAAFAIYQTIDRVPKIPVEGGQVPSKDVKGKIRLKNIQFHYPTRSDIEVLKGLNLTVSVGSTVALVGPSGCGKSSVMQLLQRFYDPGEGTITLDGTDIKEFNVKWLRKQFGLVGQEPVLFSGTIAENIAWGTEEATREQIESAAKSANAHNFITSFENGYDTQVGEKGAQLSGGQKQRIAIARALITNPKILLLDEATSALDSESEHIVQEALDKIMKDRTTIVIAHRLSTIRHATQIAVIHEGQVSELGTHEELMAKDGQYAKMVKLQSETENAMVEADVEGKEKEGDSKAAKKADVKEKEEEAKSVSLMRVIKMNSPEFKYILVGCVGSLFLGVMNPLFALIFSEMVNLYYQPEDQIRDDARWWALLFVAIGLVPLIFNSLQGWMFAIAGENLTKRLRERTFKALLGKEIGWFDDPKHSTGILTAKLATEATLVEGLVGIRLALTLQNIVTIIAGLTISFYYGWKLTLVILAASPLIVFANAMQMMALVGFSKKNQKSQQLANQVATESIGNIRTILSFTSEAKVSNDFESRLGEPARIGMRSALLKGFLTGLGEFFLYSTYTIGFWYGGTLVGDGEMAFIDVMKVFMAIVLSAMSVGQSAAMLPDATKAKQAAKDIFDIIDHEGSCNPWAETGATPKSIKGRITLQDIDFFYPSRPNIKVLDKLTLSAKPGKVLALVGQSGCGKSSTVSLIERFYDASSGKVAIDKHKVEDLNVHWLRKQIGLVSQEPVLFAGSIAENIAYGKPDADMEEIEEAAKGANAHTFITSFTDGYNTEVGEKGTQLSGGQKQRIAIARAMIRNPKILLLDEATSALDSESEKVVQEALDAAMKDRTTVVIAHRLSTIRHADQIAVISKGKVIELGTHDELMQGTVGVYQKMYKRQNS